MAHEASCLGIYCSFSFPGILKKVWSPQENLNYIWLYAQVIRVGSNTSNLYNFGYTGLYLVIFWLDLVIFGYTAVILVIMVIFIFGYTACFLFLGEWSAKKPTT